MSLDEGQKAGLSWLTEDQNFGKTAAKIRSVEDARLLAKRRLPPFLYELYESGHGAGLTMDDGVGAFNSVKFMPRAAVSYPERSLETSLFGEDLRVPLMLCPVGALRTGAPGQGEIAAARAAGAAGVAQGVSSFTGYGIEDVVKNATAPVYFQLFMLGGREGSEAMIRRARDAGCSALLVTVDIASPGGERERPYNQRAFVPLTGDLGDTLKVLPQMALHLPWLRDYVRDGMPGEVPMKLDENGDPTPLTAGVAEQLDRIPTWDDLGWIREVWGGKIALKGILRVDDAIRARDAGVDAIIVSNHGGNHLDGGLPSLQALPPIAAAVGDDLQIILDGGVRRGSDVVKALALGAACVGIGRAYVYALLAAGEAGVRQILQLFAEGIENTMAAIGCPSLDALDSSYVHAPADWTAAIR